MKALYTCLSLLRRSANLDVADQVVFDAALAEIYTPAVDTVVVVAPGPLVAPDEAGAVIAPNAPGSDANVTIGEPVAVIVSPDSPAPVIVPAFDPLTGQPTGGTVAVVSVEETAPVVIPVETPAPEAPAFGDGSYYDPTTGVKYDRNPAWIFDPDTGARYPEPAKPVIGADEYKTPAV